MTKDTPFSLNFKPTKRNPNKINLFTQPSSTQQIPEAKYKTSTGNFASKYINTPIIAPDRLGMDAITDQDHLNQEIDLRSAIRSSLETEDGIDLNHKVEAAQFALEEGEAARSVGQVFHADAYPEVLEPVAEAIDTNIVRDDNHANILTNLGEDPELTSMEQVLDTTSNALSNFIKTAASAFPIESIKELSTFIPEGKASRGLLERIVQLSEEGSTNPFEIAETIGDTLGGRLKEAGGMTKDATLRDVLEFVSFLPVDADAEIDIQNAVKIVFSDDTLDGRISNLSQWDTEFRNKYGDEGYTQLATFMIKEGLVDAATLALALRSPKLAGKLISNSRNKILTRLTKALGRASVMGVGGTGVQASIDSYLGFETNIPAEFALRTGGIFVGEGVARGLFAAGKGILGSGVDLIESGAKLFGVQGHKASSAGRVAVVNSVGDVLPTNVHDTLVENTSKKLGVPPEVIKKTSLGKVVTSAAKESNTEPYRSLATESNEGFRKGNVGTLGYIFDMTESEIKATALGVTPLKQDIMLHGVGNRIIGETITKQTDVDNILNYYFDHGLRQVTRRESTLKGDASLFRWKELASEPRNFIGDIADDLFDELLNKDVYQKALLDAQTAAFKGLKKPARNKVLTVREEMETLANNDPDFVITQSALDRKGLNANEQDAYWATGKLLDFSGILAETTMLTRAAQRGLKQLPDGRIVEFRKIGEEVGEGLTRVKEVGIGKVDFDVPTGDVSEVTRVMGYKKNFLPRRPKDADYLVGKLNTETGEISVPFASRYKGEMQDKILQMDAELEGSSEVAFYFRNMTDEKSLNFGLANNSTSVMDNLDDTAIAKIREALSDTGRADLKDMDMEQLRLAFDTTTFGSIASQQVAGKRGAQGLKTVTGDAFEYKPGDEAITQHLMESSALQFRDFRNDAIHQFETEFADVLDPGANWDQVIPNILGRADKVQRAKSVQDFIRRNVFNETKYGKEIRFSIDAWADRMRHAGTTQKNMVNGLEKMPIIQGLFKQTRDGSAMYRAAASGMVFAGNLGSFITQVAPSAAMIVGLKGLTNPKHLATGWGDMLSAFTLRAGLPAKFASKEARASLKAIEQSGVLAKADIADLANVAYGQSSTVFNKVMFFVQKGEEANRANIWFTVRAEMMDQARKGELLSLNNSRLLGVEDIDNTEFSQLVSQKAKQIFLDTTQAGKLKALSGVGSVIGQFTAPIIKTHTMWFSKSLSRTEKIGASLGLFSFYGINAVPFVAAGMYTADKVGEIATGGDELSDFTMATDIANNVGKAFLDSVGDLAGFTDEDKEFFTKVTKKGGIAALTGEEVSLYHKMSIGLFITETAKGIEDPLEAIPLVSILGKAAESTANIFEMIGDIYEANSNPSSEKQSVIDLRTFMGETTKELGNALPGFGKIVDTMNNHPETRKLLNPEQEGLDGNGWITRSGKRLKTDEPITDIERTLNIFGIAPQPVQKNRDLMKGQFDRVEILKKMQDTWLDRYKNAGTASARRDIMLNAMREATEAERVLMATFQGALSIATGHSDDARYRAGTLRKQWGRRFLKVDQERIAGGRTRSRGEE